MKLTPEQLLEITKPPVLGILTTVNPDGSPQATPLWYDYDGRYFIVTAFPHRIKVRNIRRDPRVTLVVVDTVGYGDPLAVSGTAELIEEGAAEATVGMGVRYQGETDGRKAADRLNHEGPRLIIRIAPERIRHGH